MPTSKELQQKLADLLGIKHEDTDEWLYDFVLSQLRGKSDITIGGLKEGIDQYSKMSPIKRLLYKQLAPNIVNNSTAFTQAVQNIPNFKNKINQSILKGPSSSKRWNGYYEVPIGENTYQMMSPSDITRVVDILSSLEVNKKNIPNLLRGVFEQKQEIPVVSSRIIYR